MALASTAERPSISASCPPDAGTGIVFRRVDLEGFDVEAISKNVAKVSYATSLMKQGVLISTTEHLLSAFIGMGVDNAIVELDNLELPILDGSCPTLRRDDHARRVCGSSGASAPI